jgi:hypothetical protein
VETLCFVIEVLRKTAGQKRAEPLPGQDRAPLFDHYNDNMARGWESKSVEAQQAEASERQTRPRPKKMSPEEADRWREKEGLRLSRQRILQQLESIENPRHRKVLEDALADLNLKLNQP